VDLNAYVFPWWYNAATSSQQYQYNVGNAPVITVEIINTGPDDATGVVYNVDIGSGLLYEGYSADMGAVNYTSTTNDIVWNIGNIPNNGIVLLKVFVRIIQSGNQTPNVTVNGSLAHSDQYDTNPTTDGFDSCPLISSPAADVAVNQTQSVSTVGSNQYITYQITVTNNGPDNATNVKIADSLPTGLTLTSSNIPTGTTYTNGVWTIPSLANGANVTLTLTAKITATSGTIKNTATKTGETQTDPNLNNNAQTLIYTIP
jgi:uncharacterized repeat protein (TIGR01451 family)